MEIITTAPARKKESSAIRSRCTLIDSMSLDCMLTVSGFFLPISVNDFESHLNE
jgi:hypothetical protein